MRDSHPDRGGMVTLRGRGRECELLDRMIESIAGGESQALVLVGEAGVGKTALLDHAVASASGLRVARTAGVESEMELPYAAVHLLCAPMLEHLGRLAGPQREALQVVFGLSAGSVPDRFLVGLGVLGLLSEASAERPLVCVIDDAQWLDQASALTFAFIARRLMAEPVGLLFAARDLGDELRELPQLELGGLRNGDARELLGSAVRFRLDERVRDRLVAETRGNPLALLELPRGLSALQLAGGFGLLDGEALPARIEDSFVQRLESLPTESKQLLLIAAAEPVGDPALLRRAAARLGIGVSAAVGPETEGLLSIGDRVAFRHPLVRSAIYRAASPERRRAVHRALADATDPELDPDRRAWHLASAAVGPDEHVALELERSADRARARGGLAAAAAFLQRAATLSPEPAQRTRRALAAARARRAGGRLRCRAGAAGVDGSGAAG